MKIVIFFLLFRVYDLMDKNSCRCFFCVFHMKGIMIMLQHIEIKASFETSTHVVEYVFKVILYKKLLGMISKYALNQIVAKYERVSYAGIDSSRCGCVMRTIHGLPCACKLARYVVGNIPLGVIHMFWWRLSFPDQRLSRPKVSIVEEMETTSKWFKELDVCGKVTLMSKLQEIAYPNLKFMCPLLEKIKTKGAKRNQ